MTCCGRTLQEAPDSGEACESPRCFVPVANSELGHSQGQLSVTAFSELEYQAVPWAIHRFDRPLLLVEGECEHVVLVHLPMSGGLPKRGIEEIWAVHFLVATLPVFLAKEILEIVVYYRTVGQEEGRA